MSKYTQTKKWSDMIGEEMDFTIPPFQLSPTSYTPPIPSYSPKDYYD